MLRKLLIFLGLIVLIDPYLGFPADFDKVILTAVGLLIILLLSISRHARIRHETPTVLHVERTEIEDSPVLHVERDIIEDTEDIKESEDEETIVEKRVSVVRRRKKRSNNNGILDGEDV